MPSYSRIAEELLQTLRRGGRAAASRPGRFGYRTAYNFANIPWSRPGRAAGRGFGRAVGGFLGLSGQKKFIIPVLAGATIAGGLHGMADEAFKDPNAQAWMVGGMNRNVGGFQSRYPQELGTPLGYTPYGRYNIYGDTSTTYPSRSIAWNDPLKASGQLALATFATRHGR
jgi:hypothetical protein